MDATAKLLAIVALAAFATERILAAVKYIMDAVRLSRVKSGFAVRMRARERRKLVLLVIGAVIAYVVVDRADLRLFRVLQMGHVHPLVDLWMTWLIVFAGADRVHSMLGDAAKGGAAPEHADTPVVRVQVDGGPVRDLQRVG